MRTRLKEEISDKLHTVDTKRIRADKIALNNKGFLDSNKRWFEIQFNKCKRFRTLTAGRLLRVVSLKDLFSTNRYTGDNAEVQKISATLLGYLKICKFMKNPKPKDLKASANFQLFVFHGNTKYCISDTE